MRAATRRARSRRAALALFPPASGRPAGAAPASLEHDQDLALLDHLRLLHPDFPDRARPGRRDRDLHLHRLEADELGFDLGHLFSKHRLWRACSIVATPPPRSRTRRAAFSMSSPLLLAILPSST